MKIYTNFSLIIILFSCVMFASCNKNNNDLTPQEIIKNKIEIVPPKGVSFDYKTFKLYDWENDYIIKNGLAEVTSDELMPGLKILEDTISGLTLFKYWRNIDTLCRIDAKSTSEYLLMVNHLTSQLTDEDFKLLNSYYVSDPEFSNLVKEIEKHIILKSTYFVSNNEVARLIAKIQSSVEAKMGLRTTELKGNHIAIKSELLQSGFTLQNYSSFLPYYGSVTMPNGKTTMVDLGAVSVENSTLLHQASDVINKIRGCTDNAGPLGCVPSNFFTAKRPDKITIGTDQDGMYTVKVANMFADCPGGDELAFQAGVRTWKIVADMFLNVVVDNKYSKWVSDCALDVVIKYATKDKLLLLKSALEGADSKELISIVMNDFVSVYYEVFVCIAKQDVKTDLNRLVLIAEKIEKMALIVNFWKHTTLATNIAGLGASWYLDKNCYELQFEFKNGVVKETKSGIHGVLTVVPYCEKELTWDQKVIDRWGYGLTFVFERDFSNYPNKYLLLFTPDGKKYGVLPLNYHDFSTAFGFSTNGGFLKLYSIDDMKGLASEPSFYGYMPNVLEGIYSMKIVLATDEIYTPRNQMVFSEEFKFSSASNMAILPCRSGIGSSPSDPFKIEF